MSMTLAGLKGTFGFYRFGTGPNLNIAAIGFIQFDGKGGTKSFQQTSKSGTFQATPPSFSAISDQSGPKTLNIAL
jgi:hypothetical protein